MGKIVAIDFGLKRSGLAITDESNTIAFGLTTVDSPELLDFLHEVVRKENVSEIVLGFPKSLSNENTDITHNVSLLKDTLQQEFAEVKINLIDERFTSKMASQAMHTAGATKHQKKQKKIVDMVSATIILQSYLAQK